MQYIVIPKTEKQFNVLSGLITRADMIIHAGDPDEEGQLLIEEILSYCGNKAPVKRVLINDLNKDAVRQAMRNLQDNRAFYGLYQKALARSAGDYLFGLNMTRAYTIAAREKGHNEILSVGRVQTPVLGLVVRRYEENRDYKKYDYWCVQAEFIDTDTIISPMLVPPEDAPVDDKGRIISEQYCDEVIRSCKGQQASVSLAESEIKSRRPPLPFSLLDLQVKMNRQYGFTAEKVLEITQKLSDHVLIGLCGVGADHRLAVGFKPQPAPLRHSIVLVVVHRDAPVVPDGLCQFLFAFSLRPGGHAFLNGAAGAGVDALGVSALPAAIGFSADATLTVCSFLCHCSSLLLQHKQIPQNL